MIELNTDLIEQHQSLTELIDKVQMYIRAIESTDHTQPGFAQLVINQIRMEARLKELLVNCREIL